MSTKRYEVREVSADPNPAKPGRLVATFATWAEAMTEARRRDAAGQDCYVAVAWVMEEKEAA